ncbi:hypothetical protein KKA66_02735 [Patescibacteria group bacterium]|nr:hypothetical protein [Patescibacteria group bacterium]
MLSKNDLQLTNYSEINKMIVFELLREKERDKHQKEKHQEEIDKEDFLKWASDQTLEIDNEYEEWTDFDAYEDYCYFQWEYMELVGEFNNDFITNDAI